MKDDTEILSLRIGKKDIAILRVLSMKTRTTMQDCVRLLLQFYTLNCDSSEANLIENVKSIYNLDYLTYYKNLFSKYPELVEYDYKVALFYYSTLDEFMSITDAKVWKDFVEKAKSWLSKQSNVDVFNLKFIGD